MPLSIDLRERVIGAIDGGMRKSKAAIIFKVCRRVIYKWLEFTQKNKQSYTKNRLSKRS